MTDRMTLAEYRKVAGKSSVSPSGRVVLPVARMQVQNAMESKPKRSKFGNVKTSVDSVGFDGIVFDSIIFDSKREAQHWLYLRAIEARQEIWYLKRQVRYELHVCGVKVCAYIADFEYWRDGKLIVADSKGMKTPMYKLKKKMMLAEYGIEILEM